MPLVSSTNSPSRLSWEAVGILVFGFATARLLNSSFLDNFFDQQGHTLVVSVVPMITFIAYIWISGWKTANIKKIQFWLVVASTLFVILSVTHRQVNIRAHSALPTVIHDGAVQSEEAGKFLLHGVDPYAADYSRTPFVHFPNLIHPGQPSVAWTHYAYPPINFLLTIPVTAVQRALGIFPDSRWLYLLAFFGLVALLCVRADTWSTRTRIALFTLGNPLVWMYSAAGFNDILFVFFLAATAALMNRRPVWAGIAFGLAMGAKQNVWLLVPLWTWWLWLQYRRGEPRQKKAIGQAFLASVMTTAVIFLPFMVWNFPALFDDLVRYVSGSIPNSYPIAGTTLLQYLRIWHIIDSPLAPFPAWIVQALVGLPMLYVTGRWLNGRVTAGQWLVSGAVFILSILLVSRYFFENYASALTLLALSAYALEHDPRTQGKN